MHKTNETASIDSDIGKRRLCSDCVGEEFLSNTIAEQGDLATCFYCGREAKTFTIDDMADEIEIAFDKHFYQTSTEPSSLEYTMMKESDWDWEREGEPIIYAVEAAVEIDESPAEDICEVLAERHADMELAQMGDECQFDSDSYYAEKDTDDLEYSEQWKFFEKSLKSEARFFSRTANATLEAVFEDLHDHRTRDGGSVIVEAGPGAGITTLFRARVFQSDDSLETALKHPDIEIGPPPSLLAPAGRMNARGISVFYAATAPGIAIAEVRPPVGSRVVIGQFEIIRAVRLLDVEALRSVTVQGSIFDREYDHRLKRAKFLEKLSHRLTMPVMPDDEPFDYLATQAVADYLATVAEPPLDGIIFQTAQSVKGGLNIVLFHKASRVELIDLPRGTEISASLLHWSDEGPEIDYWVSEKVPTTVPPRADGGTVIAEFLPTGFNELGGKFDTREVTLRLEVAALQVHHVEQVVFNSTAYTVNRHRSKKSNNEF